MKRVILLSLLLFLTPFIALAGSNNDEDVMHAAHHKKKFRYSKVVSLSHTITTTIPLWPGDPHVEFKTIASLETDGYFLRSFTIGEHSATHMNAPNSFFKNGRSINDYPPESLVVPAVVINVRHKVAHNNDYVISFHDITAWERKNGDVPAGSLVLFYTGFQAHWQNPQRFFNADANGGLHFPGVDGDTTAFLLRERRIAGIGIDTHGTDPGLDQEFRTNKQVLEKNGIILECLNNLNRLPPRGATVVIGALALKGGSGTPVSVLAFVP
jgi:kynurenine formamidase